MGEVSDLGDAREARIDMDSVTSIRLIKEATQAAQVFVDILNRGVDEIKDLQQLKALIDEVKKLANDTIVDAALDVEVKKRLYNIGLDDGVEE